MFCDLAPDARRAAVLLTGAALAILLFLALPTGARAATFNVSNTNDVADPTPADATCDTPPASAAAGACTLRAAIQTANQGSAGADTINLAAGHYTLSVGGKGEDAAATGDLDVSDDLTIAGAGARGTIVDANGIDRAFHIQSGTITLTLSGLTVTGGDATGDIGGGILIESNSTLDLDHSTLDSNTADLGGGINNRLGVLNIDSSTLSHNTAPGCCGGAINNFEKNGATSSIVNSTISDNSASGGSGGFFNYCGGGPCPLTLLNDTVAGNSAQGVAGATQDEPGSDVHATNTIIAGNTANGQPNCYEQMTSEGNNLDDDNSCFGGSSDIHADPLLGALADNGGPTDTRGLEAGSPAIDAALDSACPATDQRGVARPVGAHCDIGAFEGVLGTQTQPITGNQGSSGSQAPPKVAAATNQTPEQIALSVVLRVRDTGGSVAHLRRHRLFRVPGLVFYCPKQAKSNCSAAVSVSLAGGAAARRVVASGTVTVAPGRTRGVKLALSKRGRKLLARHGKLMLSAHVSYSAAQAAAASEAKRFKLVTRRRHHSR